jgi:magnesium transporter
MLEKLLDDDSDLKDLNLTAKEVARQQEGRPGRTASAAPFDVPLRIDTLSGAKSPVSPRSASLTYDSDEEEEEAIEEVEMLLEAYFMQIDNTWNKLQTLTEYVDDTEDFINIELDSHRNQLIRLDLVLTAVATSLSMVTAVTSLFAMNIQVVPGMEQAPYSYFVAITSSSAVGAVLLFASVMAYCRYMRLM